MRRVAGLCLQIIRDIGHEYADAPHRLELLRAPPAGTLLPRRRENLAPSHELPAVDLARSGLDPRPFIRS
jgi:hypothetical protein